MNKGINPEPLFERLSAPRTGIDFANNLLPDDSLNLYEFDPFYNGGGVAIGDINNDGLSDIYFSGNMTSGRLYLNKGDFKFEDITAPAGVPTNRWARGVAMADVNGDGFKDLYICMAGTPNLLFINQGDLTFIEQASKYGLDDPSWSTHAAFLDYDRDGDLDLYLITRSQELLRFSNVDPRPRKGESENTDKFFRSDGNGSFIDVTSEVGIDFKGNGLGVVVTDVNKDGWPDVYVANDQVYNDFLYINNQNGTFTESSDTMFTSQSFSGMGTDAADFNNDGLVDIMVVDMLPESFEQQTVTIGDMRYDRFNRILNNGYRAQYQRNVLQLNTGVDFSEIGQLAGVDKTDWSWGVLFGDFDNDGLKDIVVSTGMVKSLNNLDYIMYNRPASFEAGNAAFKKRFLIEMERLSGVMVPNKAYRNNGDLAFSDATTAWGLDTPSFSYGMAYGDLDNDGDLDLVFSNLNAPADIYRNRSETRSNNYLRVQLRDSISNRNLIGSSVTLFSGGKKQFQELSPFRGYQSTVHDVLHFGLGASSNVDSLHVTFINGSVCRYYDVPANRIVRISPCADTAGIPGRNGSLIFSPTDRSPMFRHQDRAYNDFAYQSTLLHGLSEWGPAIATSDVDRDGDVDLFVSGGKGQAGNILVQGSDGAFQPHQLPSDASIHETDAEFLDVNQDGFIDLYVAAGGSAYGETSSQYDDRIFINDGQGRFDLDSTAIDPYPFPTTVVKSCDFDRDGWPDVFTGGGAVPGNYPMFNRSRLLQNKNGHLTDVTKEMAPALDSAGLVTDALWVDIDQDGWNDLVIAAEWKAIRIFKNTGGRFVEVTAPGNPGSLRGWWQSLATSDLDNDGDPDIIAGNFGGNSRLRASRQEPVTMLVKDFDGNGEADPIYFHYVQGISRPVHVRDRLSDQMPMIKKKYTRYIHFTTANQQNIFTDLELEGADELRVENLSSVVMINNGNGTFEVRPLPRVAQIAPVRAIVPVDFDKDGNMDLVLAGNSESTDVFLGYQNSGEGCVLKGNGDGTFTSIPSVESGFRIRGVVGSATIFTSGNNRYLLLGRYRDTLRAFRIGNSFSPGFQDTSTYDRVISGIEIEDPN